MRICFPCVEQNHRSSTLGLEIRWQGGRYIKGALSIQPVA
jgi:hypothetical protein